MTLKSRLRALLALSGIWSCLDTAPELEWPSPAEAGARVALFVDAEGGRTFFRPSEDDVLALNVGAEAELFVLDFECADLDALGFAPGLGNSLSAPTNAVRRPDRLYRLEHGGAPVFKEVMVEPDAPELATLGLELRFPIGCKIFEPAKTGIVFVPGVNGRVLNELQDGTLLMVAGAESGDGLTAYRFRSPTDFESYPIPGAYAPHALAVGSDGLLWIFNRSGRLWRGSIDDLPRIAETFEAMPRGPESHSCAEVSGRQAKVQMDVRAVTATLSEVLVTDGSGTIHRFARDAWTTLHDPVANGQPELQCRIQPIAIQWLETNRALTINRSLGQGQWQLTRIEIAEDGETSFLDDELPEGMEGAERILDLGGQDFFVSGSRGAIARRGSRGWSLLEVRAALTRDSPAFSAAPDGRLVLGNLADGLVQVWPDAPGGPVACSNKAPGGSVKALARLGRDYVLGLPSDDSQGREVLSWSLRDPTACELFPN